MAKFLEKISALLSEGIYLEGIFIDPSGKEANNFKVSLSGRASLVENVIELNERLKKEKEFSQIYFPPDTWFEKQNFIFNVAFLAALQNDVQE